ncbi:MULTISPECIES: MerR family transcriptional regulator [Bacillales]|uniref:MerR family transcriptional regulator n=1 Tax=Bacillales TaxID=1385 RepID=UPI0006A76958|nr:MULTISPECIES: MerR family transcriptional regulator [Bacillales]OBZ09359.1 transcriptional regulator [Bacillus sp. FJAT-26390]
MTVRPIDIARKLKISTTALRHYESWGIIPPVERGANGYRIYTEEHIAYFECIRAMNEGFGMMLTKNVLWKVLCGEIDAALWLMNGSQASLHRDKTIAEKTIRALETDEIDLLHRSGKRKWMTIGEVSDETTIPSSAIRHWEKMGLITIHRDKDNGYRSFSPANLRQILIIRTFKSAIWSLEIIQQVIKEVDDNNVENAIKIARESLQFLDRINRSQLRGAHYLYQLLHLKDQIH